MKKKKEPNEELRKLAHEAQEAGTTYGQYTAKKYLEEQMAIKEREAKKIELLATKQAENIQLACLENDLGGSITWFSAKRKPHTEAEKIASKHKSKPNFPSKVSFMYCDELDMCFFYDTSGNACVTYSGIARAGSGDIREGLVKAFQIAEKVLDRMQELVDMT